MKSANLILALFSSLTGLVGIEILLHFNVPYNGTPIYKKDGKTIDDRDASRTLYDLFAEGIQAYPTVYPFLYIELIEKRRNQDGIFPLGGISQTVSTLCNELNNFVVYKSDRFGFYNDDRLWDQSPKALLVGDSFAQGACVPPNATIGANLTQLGLPTVSIAMAGNGPLLELAGLIEYGTVIRPPLVIWQFAEGRYGRNNFGREMKSAVVRRYLDANFRQDLARRQPEIDKLLKAMVEDTPEYQSIKKAAGTSGALYSISRFRSIRAILNKAFKKARVDVQATEPVLRDDLTDTEGNLRDLSLILVRAKKLVSSWGGEVIFVSMPTWESVKRPESVNSKVKEELLQTARAAGIPMVDLHVAFATLKNPVALYAYPDRNGHLTEEGYRTASMFILDAIRQSKNAPPEPLKFLRPRPPQTPPP